MFIQVIGEGVLAAVRELKDRAKGQVFKRLAVIQALGFTGEFTIPDAIPTTSLPAPGTPVVIKAQVTSGYKGATELVLQEIKPRGK